MVFFMSSVEVEDGVVVAPHTGLTACGKPHHLAVIWGRGSATSILRGPSPAFEALRDPEDARFAHCSERLAHKFLCRYATLTAFLPIGPELLARHTATGLGSQTMADEASDSANCL